MVLNKFHKYKWVILNVRDFTRMRNILSCVNKECIRRVPRLCGRRAPDDSEFWRPPWTEHLRVGPHRSIFRKLRFAQQPEGLFELLFSMCSEFPNSYSHIVHHFICVRVCLGTDRQRAHILVVYGPHAIQALCGSPDAVRLASAAPLSNHRIGAQGVMSREPFVNQISSICVIASLSILYSGTIMLELCTSTGDQEEHEEIQPALRAPGQTARERALQGNICY